MSAKGLPSTSLPGLLGGSGSRCSRRSTRACAGRLWGGASARGGGELLGGLQRCCVVGGEGAEGGDCRGVLSPLGGMAGRGGGLLRLLRTLWGVWRYRGAPWACGMGWGCRCPSLDRLAIARRTLRMDSRNVLPMTPLAAAAVASGATSVPRRPAAPAACAVPTAAPAEVPAAVQAVHVAPPLLRSLPQSAGAASRP